MCTTYTFTYEICRHDWGPRRFLLCPMALIIDQFTCELRQDAIAMQSVCPHCEERLRATGVEEALASGKGSESPFLGMDDLPNTLSLRAKL